MCECDLIVIRVNMEFVRGLHNIRARHKGCVLAIGNFDGFHLGHQKLITQLKEKGRNYKLPVVVMTFEPQPKEFFFKTLAIRLTRLRDKINYLSVAGVDIILCVAFSKKFASFDAYSFIKYVLIYKLGVKFIYVGDDFRFGAFRKGDCFLLNKVSKRAGFQVIRANILCDKNKKKISSTAIRIALIENRILDAELLLGHSYCISGRVMRGNALGRTIGFPTINISLQGKIFPIHGVYAVEVYGIYNIPLPGIANIGMRPTISGKHQQQLEVHLLNISANLYAYYIKVVFLSKIRDEQRFTSIKKLQSQIIYDVMKVRNYFNQKSCFNSIYYRNNL